MVRRFGFGMTRLVILDMTGLHRIVSDSQCLVRHLDMCQVIHNRFGWSWMVILCCLVLRLGRIVTQLCLGTSRHNGPVCHVWNRHNDSSRLVVAWFVVLVQKDQLCRGGVRQYVMVRLETGGRIETSSSVLVRQYGV
jgi:hypothetical protein